MPSGAGLHDEATAEHLPEATIAVDAGSLPIARTLANAPATTDAESPDMPVAHVPVEQAEASAAEPGDSPRARATASPQEGLAAEPPDSPIARAPANSTQSVAESTDSSIARAAANPTEASPVEPAELPVVTSAPGEPSSSGAGSAANSLVEGFANGSNSSPAELLRQAESNSTQSRGSTSLSGASSVPANASPSPGVDLTPPVYEPTPPRAPLRVPVVSRSLADAREFEVGAMPVAARQPGESLSTRTTQESPYERTLPTIATRRAASSAADAELASTASTPPSPSGDSANVVGRLVDPSAPQSASAGGDLASSNSELPSGELQGSGTVAPRSSAPIIAPAAGETGNATHPDMPISTNATPPNPTPQGAISPKATSVARASEDASRAGSSEASRSLSPGSAPHPANTNDASVSRASNPTSPGTPAEASNPPSRASPVTR